jgi:hypothetical protein
MRVLLFVAVLLAALNLVAAVDWAGKQKQTKTHETISN